jgi:hypothetical protein
MYGMFHAGISYLKPDTSILNTANYFFKGIAQKPTNHKQSVGLCMTNGSDQQDGFNAGGALSHQNHI